MRPLKHLDYSELVKVAINVGRYQSLESIKDKLPSYSLNNLSWEDSQTGERLRFALRQHIVNTLKNTDDLINFINHFDPNEEFRQE